MEDILKLREKTKKLNLLFVEDSDIVRMSTVALFEEFFDEIFIGVDGKEGYESYLEYKDEIDLIISDVNMPVMNGFEMIKLIREKDLNIPILLLTGSSHEDIEKQIKDLNIQEAIAKPIVISDFVKCLNKII